jgi:SAM-dependent methyltransferase
LSFTLRYARRDETKNYLPAEAAKTVSDWLGKDFLQGDLYTTEKDYFIQYNKKREPNLRTAAPSHASTPNAGHDKAKKRLITADTANYLHLLGVANADGTIKKEGQKKFKQINKYIEIIDSLLAQQTLPPKAHIVDMGSGKGYLTFALYDYLTGKLGLDIEMTGIELRPALVDLCNDIASKCGFENLRFAAQDIRDYQPGHIDMLIALHACDTATDEAIAKGILSDSAIIVVAPCCHKQIRKEMHSHGDMQAILKHGILEERQAELITDGLRALLMEANGYATKVFEFISTEHTSKNLMITGLRTKPQPEALAKVEAIKQAYGIKRHFLEQLLATPS